MNAFATQPAFTQPAKATLVEIQADEYGGGRPERMHAELFRATVRWLELDDNYGHYVPAVPAVTLAVSHLMSLFALHRRWTGALLGHLAALEMTSTGPNRLYSAGARRLGASAQQRRYFDEHVEADAVHEQIAAYDRCGGYAADHPTVAADVLFGAACCLALDDALAGYLLSRWQAGQPSVRPPAQPPQRRLIPGRPILRRAAPATSWRRAGSASPSPDGGQPADGSASPVGPAAGSPARAADTCAPRLPPGFRAAARRSWAPPGARKPVRV